MRSGGAVKLRVGAADRTAGGTGPRDRSPERPCHNDLLNANFIDDGRRIRIVDWEYAGMGDVFFDLANFSVNHGFGPDERERCSQPTSERCGRRICARSS